jgi:23S rRNA pseudouridine955/2504/2580 synthase
LQKLGLKRMFLHAWQLKFQHPVNARPVTVKSPLPAALQQFIDSVQPPIPV